MAKIIILKVDQVMNERGISTAELATRAGISYNTALSLKRGYTRKIDFSTLASICEVLNVGPGDILDLIDEQQK